MKEKLVEQNKALKIVANIISVLLHPVFMPIISCSFLFYLMPQSFEEVKAKVISGWAGMIIINTIIFPIILILLLKGLGFIKSIYLRDVKERVIPLIGIMVFYFWPYLVAKNVAVPDAARILLLGNFWGIVVVFIITIFFKISMHTSGVGSLLGFVFVLMLLAQSFFLFHLLLALLMAILIIWARYYSGAHRAKELWLGILVGIVAQFGAYLYL
jgi:hypothetical protein